MDKIPFEDGKKLKNAFVTIDGKEHEVTPAQYQGKTPMSSFNLNKMQNNIENTLVKVSPTEPKPKADVWLKKGKNLLNLLDCIFIPNRSTASIISKNKSEITLKGTASTFQYVDLRFFLEAGTYTLQRKWELTNGTGGNYTGIVAINDVTTSSTIELGAIGKNENFKTFTIDHDAQIRLFLYLSAGTALPNETQVRFYDMQIIKSSSEEEFEECVEPKVYVKNNNNEYIPFTKQIIQSITTESGTAIKFADGTMICYGKIDTGSRNFTEQFGSVYYDNIPYNIVYPMQFIETPIISISQELGGYFGGNSIGGLPTNTKAQVYVYTMRSATLNRNAIIYWQAIGRWK